MMLFGEFTYASFKGYCYIVPILIVFHMDAIEADRTIMMCIVSTGQMLKLNSIPFHSLHLSIGEKIPCCILEHPHTLNLLKAQCNGELPKDKKPKEIKIVITTTMITSTTTHR